MIALNDLAKKALDHAIKLGVDQCDVFVQDSSTRVVEIERSTIATSSVIEDSGISVRAYYRGGLGFAYTMRIDADSAAEISRRAASLSKKTQSDPEFKSLPEPRDARPVEGLYDRELAEMSAEGVLRLSDDLLNGASEVGGSLVSGMVAVREETRCLLNSLGVEIEERGTWSYLSMMSIVREGDLVGSFADFDGGRRLRDLKAYELGRKVSEKAREYLGARSVKTSDTHLILGHVPVFWTLAGIVGSCLSAESVQRDRSFLAGRLNDRIASNSLTITDDGTAPSGLGSSIWDGEGVPRKRISVVSQGVLKSYLYDSYTAGKAGVESTGHAVRPSYKRGVEIAPTNIQIALGDRTLEEIIADTKDGVLIESGALAPNPVNGEISTSIDFGFKIEKGEISHPLKNAMIGANAAGLLRGIVAVSKDYREEPGSIIPAILFDRVRISGGL